MLLCAVIDILYVLFEYGVIIFNWDNKLKNLLLIFIVFCSSILNAADHNKRHLEQDTENTKRAKCVREHENEGVSNIVATFGNPEALRALIDQGHGAKLRMVDSFGKSALSHAIEQDYSEETLIIVNYLGIDTLDVGARVTAATMAAYWEDKELLKALMEKGADLKIASINNVSPLYWAIYNQDVEMVLLIVQKLGVNYIDVKNGMTPAMMAAHLGKNEVVNALIKEGADLRMCDKSNRTALRLAIGSGHIDVALDISQHLGINSLDAGNGMTAAMMAVCVKKMELLVELLKRGARLDIMGNNGYAALYLAIMNDDLEMVSYLAKAQNGVLMDIPVTSTNIFPVNFAACKGKTNAVKALIDHGFSVVSIDIHGNQDSCLTAAVRSRNPSTLKLLLEKVGANMTDGFWRTPLMIAAMLNDYNMFTLLLEHGASITSRDTSDKTVAFYAKDPEFKKFLARVKKNQEIKKELFHARLVYQNLVPNLGSAISDMVLDYLPEMIAMGEVRRTVKNEMLLKELLEIKKKSESVQNKKAI